MEFDDVRTLVAILALTVSYCSFGSPEGLGLYVPSFDGSVTLTGMTSGVWRWMDVADQEYSTTYQGAYSYSDATVTITFNTTGYDLIGHVTGTGLKPNFAYQLKLLGFSGTASNERIGYRGRWWQEQWVDPSWTNGQNLNNKGDGSFPSPNDNTYNTNKIILDGTSPTGYAYKHSAYRLLGYFVTDANGDIELDFTVNNSYHVLWKETQRAPSSNDGSVITHAFAVDTSIDTAYPSNYPSTSVGVFGEWERLPKDAIEMLSGDYNCQFILTEESFHGNYWSNPAFGQWAMAMYGDVNFTIWAGSTEPDISVTPSGTTLPNTPINRTSQRTFTIINNGTEDLLLLGVEPVTFIGADAGYFSIDTQPASPIASGITGNFIVNYKPTAVGSHAITMRIASNDPDTPYYDVILTGFGFVRNDKEDWDDKLKDDVKCGLQSGSDGGIPFYSLLILVIGLCSLHRFYRSC